MNINWGTIEIYENSCVRVGHIVCVFHFRIVKVALKTRVGLKWRRTTVAETLLSPVFLCRTYSLPEKVQAGAGSPGGERVRRGLKE